MTLLDFDMNTRVHIIKFQVLDLFKVVCGFADVTIEIDVES